jgi:hypothetical protein
MREGVDIFALQMFVGAQYHHIEMLCKMHRDARWTPHGPAHQGVFYAKSVNEMVEHLHIYQQDHSLRACAYAEPEKEYERYTLPFQRTYVCSDPPIFMLASEDTSGRLRPKEWAKEMVAAGLPKAFTEKFEKAVAEAIESYGGRRPR